MALTSNHHVALAKAHCLRGAILALLIAGAVITSSGLGMAASSLDSVLAEAERLYAGRENLDNVQKSVELLRQAIHDWPSADGAYWRLARSLRWVAEESEKKKRVPILEEAKEMAERAVSLNPESVDGYYWLAACTGRWGEERGILQSLFAVKPMKQALDKVVALNPDYARAHYVLSELYRKVPGAPISIGNKKRALEEAQLAVKLDSHSTTFMLELAEAYLANNNKAEAKKALQKVIDMPPTPGEPVESHKDKARAKELLQKL